MMRSGSLQYSQEDETYVTGILGKTPHAVVGVAARDDAGRPSVIINLPLIRVAGQWEPFPTLYWLVDPALSTAIAHLEHKGVIGEIERLLTDDENLMQAHLADNKLYARSRWAVLKEAEKLAAEEEGYRQTLQTTGIGGVANHASIKCLHAQFAFHLARSEVGTTVGKLLVKRYGIRLPH